MNSMFAITIIIWAFDILISIESSVIYFSLNDWHNVTHYKERRHLYPIN